jgi:hypothetical protein
MRSLIVIMLLFFMGCSNYSVVKPPMRKFPNVHQELRPFVYKFHKFLYQFKGESVPDDIVVKLQNIEGYPRAGGVYNRVFNVTTIAKDKFRTKSFYQKEYVVFHELGHHVLGLSHDFLAGNVMADGCSRSMMYFKTIPEKCYKDFYKYYIIELFSRTKPSWRKKK